MSTASPPLASACCGGSAAPFDGSVWWRIAIGVFLAFNSMTVALAVNMSKVDREQRLVLQGIPLCVCLIVGILLGGPMMSGVWREWRARRLTVESLFLLSSVGAFLASLISYITGEGPVFFEVVSILFVVYALGKELGRYGQEKVLQALGRWDPAALTCEVVEAGGISRMTQVAQVQPGERVRVHPGSMIPVDGFVCEGESFVHEASMSGEAFAASRRAGDRVLAGTHVVDATLIVEADAGGTARCIDRISAVLQEAALQPGESQLAANRIMQWFVPFVTATALATFGVHAFLHGWMTGLFNAMAVLLIACPCALGFATPVAIWTAMRRLNAFGMVVRSGKTIENLASVNSVAFDKTGTLTLPDAAPELQLEPVWRDRHALVEEMISAAESAVEHPIAKALRPLSGASTFTARSVRLEPGLGIRAEVESSAGARHTVRIVKTGDPLDDAGHRLAVEIDRDRAASILLREAQRPLVAETIHKLETMGITSILVTGDSPSRAANLPLPELLSRMTPEQKLAVVREKKRKGETVLFVGDGINDAAAMAESDISIAVGPESLTREVADIEWPLPDLSSLPKAISLSRQTVRLIHSNLIFALCYNVVGIATAAAGFIHPVVAALLMTTSSCVVTFRSLQLLESDGA
jgi:Cu2+-exporting ATPase/Cu+-exporting ATPase